MLTLNCPRCELALNAEDEDDLVEQVRAHVREAHDFPHELSRRHILHRLRAQTGGGA